MDWQFVFLKTDVLVFVLLALLLLMIIRSSRDRQTRQSWGKVLRKPLGVSALLILTVYLSVGFLDSIHFRYLFNGKHQQIDENHLPKVYSALDLIVSPLGLKDEKTYSAPFSTHLYAKEFIILADGSKVREHPKLRYGGQHLQNNSLFMDVAYHCLTALLKTVAILTLLGFVVIHFQARKNKISKKEILCKMFNGELIIAWRSIFITLFSILFCILLAANLQGYYHIMGTDKVGGDVFYDVLKSIRTALVIGSLTTLLMLPFALFFGTVAGYFGGVVDDVIQFIYTVLSSIPGVLLIAASILAMQIYIDNHPAQFPTIADRADARLLALCIILGVTSWTNLCRVLRAETLKLRELDFVQAGRALGSKSFRIIGRHIIPNVMSIILITAVLDFSQLILAEAVLTYVGVGVDPTTYSWGNMIDGARLELAREPIVWWPLMSAFSFMFIFVLSANLFAESLREAFDPKSS